jgi:hypothetical protein
MGMVTALMLAAAAQAAPTLTLTAPDSPDASPGLLTLRLSPLAADDQMVTQILLDVDGNDATGFSYRAKGFDVLIEGENVYRFAGDDVSAWTWSPLGKARRTNDATNNGQVIQVEAALLGTARVQAVARRLSADYAQELAAAPADGALLVKIKPVVEGVETVGDAEDATRDLTAFTAQQRGAEVVIEAATREPGDFANLIVFFDLDGDAGTGYQPGLAPQFGFDAMTNIGGQMMKFSGGHERGAWAWSPWFDAQVERGAGRVTLRTPTAKLGSSAVGVAAWMMSGDWINLIDRAPDAGLVTVTIEPWAKGEKDDLGIAAAPVASVAMAEPKLTRDLPARARVRLAQSFYCYYGAGRVAALSHYDLVIAHDPQMARDDIAALRKLGVVVVGYITVGEDDELRTGDGTGPGGKAGWYFDRDHDGIADHNPVWKSYYANTNDPAWRADRVAQARRLVEEVGYDGIFLDTIGTVALIPQMSEGMVQLVQDFRDALPDAPIILNQGYELFDRLAPLADALMLESFTATYDFNTRRYLLNTPAALDWHARYVRQNIQPVREKHPLPVLVLDYALPHDEAAIRAAADRAATFGFLFAAAPIYLDDVYRIDYVGQVDAKWLKRQATPENLSLTLGEAMNGFPKGSRILPSGCYGGYTVAPVVDGVADRATLAWDQAAWASAEDGEAAWLCVEFPSPLTGGRLEITFALDAGQRYASRRFAVQVRRQGQWHDVRAFTDNVAAQVTVALPQESYDAVRVTQPADGGHALRPNLLWIAQVTRVP